MADSIEQLSFELTSGMLSEQQRDVSGLRMSAGTILGTGSIVASLSNVRTGDHALNVWAVLATISFALCFACAIWVLLPRNLFVSLGGAELMADADVVRAPDVTDGYRAASTWIEPHLEQNRRTIDRLADWLTVSCVLLAVEVVLCTISVTS
jgi:multisubunit Na+/H+ antiporter MnhC subunit